MKLHPLAPILLGSSALLTAPAHAAGIHIFHADHILGTSLDVTITAVAERLASMAMDAIHAEIARLELVLSGWRSDSELATLNRTAVFAASADLFHVIAASEIWRDRTGGAFSIRLGGLAAATPRNAGSWAESIGRAEVGLDLATFEIRRPDAVQFAVDAIAKGYIIDRAMSAARSVPGIQGVMIDIGGDLRCWGQAPCGAVWQVGVSDALCTADNAAPSATLAIRDGAVATSGTSARGHVIYDPATGLACEGVLMATAFAPTATDADALASALYVLAPEKGLMLADSMPGVAARIVGADGTVHTSDAWKGMVLAQNSAARPRPEATLTTVSPWPAGFTVNIEYVVPVLNGGRRARPPYVTVWISNEAGDPVRTLAFYANKARYMSENYVFWGRIGAANNALVDSVTRPTRPPGAYSLEWDGKDDAGRVVPQGRYTVNIEAAREHGGHSLQRLDIDLRTSPASADASGQQELGPAKVTYGK